MVNEPFSTVLQNGNEGPSFHPPMFAYRIQLDKGVGLCHNKDEEKGDSWPICAKAMRRLLREME